jgi:hypothetical protein
MTNDVGRAFVRVYYKYGPSAARVIAKDESLKSITRIFLKPIIWGAETFIKSDK